MMLHKAICVLMLAVSAAAQAPSPAGRYFTDVVLVDQNGRQKRLYSDLIRGRIVVLNAFFATCTGSCPVMAANMAKLQTALGDRVGKDVYLLSFSVDPEHDTPSILKDYAERFKAKPGWFFLTGSKENVDIALLKLGLRTELRENHVNLFTIGNEPTGLWKKAMGTAAVQEILKTVESVINDSP